MRWLYSLSALVVGAAGALACAAGILGVIDWISNAPGKGILGPLFLVMGFLLLRAAWGLSRQGKGAQEK